MKCDYCKKELGNNFLELNMGTIHHECSQKKMKVFVVKNTGMDCVFDSYDQAEMFMDGEKDYDLEELGKDFNESNYDIVEKEMLVKNFYDLEEWSG